MTYEEFMEELNRLAFQGHKPYAVILAEVRQHLHRWENQDRVEPVMHVVDEEAEAGKVIPMHRIDDSETRG